MQSGERDVALYEYPKTYHAHSIGWRILIADGSKEILGEFYR